MVQPRFSIIVPAYNAEATLALTLESLRAQTDGAWEAVIVDDGSTDRTAEVAAGFADGDPRLRLIRQANGGEGAARNAGLAVARGEWLVFLDADDWLLPAFLERMSAAIAAGGPVDFVHCGWVRVAVDGRQSPATFGPNEPDLFPELARRNCFAIHACTARRSLVEAVGPFDVSMKTSADWDLWQRVARTGPRVASVPAVLACYRLRPFSAVTDARRLLADGIGVIDRGHGPDPRVPAPAAAYAGGMPRDRAADAKLALACWAAGLAIGQGQAGGPLLELVAGERCAVSPELAAQYLFAAVPVPSGQLVAGWPQVWPGAEPGIDAFLKELEGRQGVPGLAADTKSLLMRDILTWALPDFLRSPATGQAPPELGQQTQMAELQSRIAELQRWIGELEAAKAWHDEQRQLWLKRAEKAERRLAWPWRLFGARRREP